MEKPLVSICCITYNHEHYIKDALDGFLMQKTNFPFEIIISNDCSKDNTRAIIEEYKKKYPDTIRDISPEQNLGAMRNFWYVQQNAQGKYVAICEGDDFWIDPYKLQKQVDFLETNHDFSMCFHGAIIKNETNTNIITTSDKIESKEYFTKDIFPGWVVPTASVVYRRESIENYPLLKHREWMKYGDIVLFLKCAHTGRVWGMEEKMSVYRMTEGGAVVSQRKEIDYNERLCKHYEFLLLNFPQINKQWICNYIAGYYYTRMRQTKSGVEKWKCFKTVIHYKPTYLLQKLVARLKK